MMITTSGLNRSRLCRILSVIILMYIFCLATLLEKYQYSFKEIGDQRENANGDITVGHQRGQPHNCTEELIEKGFLVQKNTSTSLNHNLQRKAEKEYHFDQIGLFKKEELKLLSCANISQLELGQQLGKGITKEVYKSTYGGNTIAVKMITPKVEDVRACLQRGKFTKPEECYLYANYKLLKEIVLSMQLNHRNILKILGFCVRSEEVTSAVEDHGVILVTEYGHKVTKRLVRKSNWSERIRHSIELLDLMDYLEHSPAGSLGIYDFKVSQFILINDTIKLSDMDDLSAGEPWCNASEDCRTKVIGEQDLAVNCTNNRCHGFNAKHNLLQCTHTFLESFLDYPPLSIATNVSDIMQGIRNSSYDARRGAKEFSSLLDLL